jgi:hypothetical protein
MSVRSCFGEINLPLPNDKIVYADGDGLVSIVKGMSISGDAGSLNQAVASDGNGGIAWRDIVDETFIPSLAQVCAVGNITSSAIYIGPNPLVSSSTLNLDATNDINMNCPAGLGFAGSVGAAGQILMSQADQGVPVWVTPALPEATGDLDMAGNSITNVASIINDVLPFSINPATTFIDDVTFNVAPTCSNAPNADTDLTNKIYVDTLVNTVSGVSPAVDNQWSAVQTFNAGATTNTLTVSTSASMIGTQISINGADYCASKPDITDYYDYGDGAGNLFLQNNTWGVSWPGGDKQVALPTVTPGMYGKQVTIINLNTAGDGNTLTVVGEMYNCFGRSTQKKITASFNQYGCMTAIALPAPMGGPAWMVTSFSNGVNFVNSA